MIAPASLDLNGSQALNSVPSILIRSSPYVLLPGTRFLVKTSSLPPLAITRTFVISE